MSNEQDDRWYVQFDSQEVRLMTLDELDEAYQKGLVHEETYVIPVGASDWQTLGDILGGDDDDGEAPEEPTVAPPPAVASMFAAPTQAPTFTAPPAARAPQLAPTSSWPPVAMALSVSNSAVHSNAQSVMPVVQDVSGTGDLDDAAFKPKKTKFVLAGAVALAAIGGIGVALTRLDAPPVAHLDVPAAAAAAIEPPTLARKEASLPTPAPAPAPAPAPVAAMPAPSEDKDQGSASGTSSSKLSEGMKKALLAQDEERAEKKKSRSKASSTRHASASPKTKSSGPFKGGGNAHDPLNSKL